MCCEFPPLIDYAKIGRRQNLPFGLHLVIADRSSGEFKNFKCDISKLWAFTMPFFKGLGQLCFYGAR